MTGSGQFISVQPDELKFQFELEKQSYSDLKVTNNTEHHVAFKMRSSSSYDDIPGLQHLKDERDTAMRQTRQLQQELEMLKRRSRRKSDPGFSFTFALFVGLIGLMIHLGGVWEEG
ncbi:hypothetical protein HYC85_022929 [Camellia sinensis]|uniref:MSP domain-containing protein n=1 Tax=Camellia sinensis TaxID=4442 RepID=A0A7J7GD65_CAMSI|nr:hypothetical protein HYC85_022929 [Camellia sinensis]